MILREFTVKFTPALETPETVTTTFPLVAPVGTVAVMLVGLHDVAVAGVPLKVTVLVPCVEPKFVPVIVTEELTAPDVGERLVIVGIGTTVKVPAVVAKPSTVTTRLPVVAPLGTNAWISWSLHDDAVAAVPLNVTVLEPCVAKNPDP